jgi:hypothetical protein
LFLFSETLCNPLRLKKAQDFAVLLFLGTKRGVSREDSLKNPSG